MKKINVLFISHDSGLSGAPRSMINLATTLREYNINPYILIPSHGDIEKVLKRYKLKYFIIPYYKCFREIGKVNILKECLWEIENIKSIIKIISLIKKLEINILHSNSLAVDVGAVAAYFCGCKHVWHIREFMEEDYGFEHYLKKKIKFLINRADRIISISDAIKKKYSKLYRLSDIVMIHNGLPLNVYSIDKKEIFKKNNINMLISGVICRGKGQLESIEMIEHLKLLGYNNIQLYIAGTGNVDYVKRLKDIVISKKLSNNVNFIGFHNDMKEVRLNMDIELICSKNEAFGRVTVEAMLGNLLVIAANTGGTKEIIKNRVNGLLYEQGNVTNLLDNVIFALKNKELIIKYIQRAKTDAENLYDIHNTAQKIVKLYEDLLQVKKI